MHIKGVDFKYNFIDDFKSVYRFLFIWFVLFQTQIDLCFMYKGIKFVLFTHSLHHRQGYNISFVKYIYMYMKICAKRMYTHI